MGARNNVRVGAWMLAGVAVCAIADGARAQVSDNRNGEISEIIVTAGKREQRIVDVPYAITAVGGQEIRDRGVYDIRDLQYSIPGLQINELTPGQNRIQLRGINAGSGTGLPIVGIYVDDASISIDQQQRDDVFPLVDIERVEVLRGPQGTLYGQGSVAGTIRYITKDPSLQKSDGFVETNLYSQEKGELGYRLNAAVGTPLVQDRAGVRLVAGYEHRAGWIDYTTAKVDDANSANNRFVRAKVLLEPDDRLQIRLLYQYLIQAYRTSDVSSLTDTGINDQPVLAPITNKSHLGNLVIDYDLGFATVTSSSSYQRRDYTFNIFTSGLYVNWPAVYKQFTQEVRLASKNSGPVSYVVGGWYRNFDSNFNRTTYLATTGAKFPVNGLDARGTDPVNSESYAFFGDLTYQVTKQIELSAGLRYYADTRNISSINSVTLASRAASGDFKSTSPRFNALYKFNDDVSVYATVAKGFRSGGFNGNNTTFGPESVWSYEAGTKAKLFGGRLFLDLAGYYLDYKNTQVQNISVVSGVNLAVTNNGGAASGPGVELAAQAKLAPGLTLDASIGWNDIKYDTLTLQTNPGERFAFVPPVTGSLSLNQRWNIADYVTGLWRVDYQHAAPWSSITRSLAGAQRVVLEDFSTTAQDTLNLRFGLEKGPYALYFDAQNVTNEDAVLFQFSPVATTQKATRVRPRSFGLTFRMNWG